MRDCQDYRAIMHLRTKRSGAPLGGMLWLFLFLCLPGMLGAAVGWVVEYMIDGTTGLGPLVGGLAGPVVGGSTAFLLARSQQRLDHFPLLFRSWRSWLPAEKDKRDAARGHEVAADFDRMLVAAKQMYEGKTDAEMDQGLEAFLQFREQYGHLVGRFPNIGPHQPNPVLYERLEWLAQTFRRYGYKGGVRRAKETALGPPSDNAVQALLLCLAAKVALAGICVPDPQQNKDDDHSRSVVTVVKSQETQHDSQTQGAVLASIPFILSGGGPSDPKLGGGNVSVPEAVNILDAWKKAKRDIV